MSAGTSSDPNTVEAFLAPTDAEAGLIVRGRYQIVPPEGGKAKAHTRVTNFAKKLEDGFTLTEWKLRNAVKGTALRSDIVAAAIAAGDDRGKLQFLAEQALEAASANVGRETGTALHTLTEAVDRGETLQMPDHLRADLAAYTACMERIGATVVRMEEIVVIPSLGLAGRFDRLVEIDGEPYVLDLKTGADLSYSWLSISIQLALYAEAETIYHPGAKTHEPMPAVNRDRAIVVHLPAGQAKATAYWVDLAYGRHGIDLVEQVLAWRKTKGVAVEWQPPEAVVVDAFPGAEAVYADDLRAFAVARVQGIVDAAHQYDLAERWPIGVPTLKAYDGHAEAQLDEILQACSIVEGMYAMPFPLVSDPRLRDQQPKITKQKKAGKAK